MNKYFAGYIKGKPVVFMDDGMGLVHVFKKTRTFQAAAQMAKIWQAHENKKSPIKNGNRGVNPKMLTHEN